MKNQILSTFLYNKKLKFSEIEKLLKIRSNKLSYHLTKLEKEGILKKEKDSYKLSETAEKLIPYIHNQEAALSAILIAIKKDKKIFLCKRDKRPFKDKLSLPGGRLYVGEEIEDATKRILKEKFHINGELEKINSVSLEHVIKNKQKIHSFVLIFVTAKTNDKIKYTSLKNNKDKIISSDYKLIKKDLEKVTNVKTFLTKS